MKNKKLKKDLKEIFEEYCWIIGLSILVAGFILLIPEPKALIISGFILALIGAALKWGFK